MREEWGGGGGGGAVRFRPDTKSGWGVLSASGPIRKADGVLSGASGPIQNRREGGCLAEEGEVPYMKGGVATPNPPPPPPPAILCATCK